jgi:hypothetical protein
MTRAHHELIFRYISYYVIIGHVIPEMYLASLQWGSLSGGSYRYRGQTEPQFDLVAGGTGSSTVSSILYSYRYKCIRYGTYRYSLRSTWWLKIVRSTTTVSTGSTSVGKSANYGSNSMIGVLQWRVQPTKRKRGPALPLLVPEPELITHSDSGWIRELDYRYEYM